MNDPCRILFLLVCLLLPITADAAVFRVTDTVAEPGAATATVRLVIDPQLEPMCGFQFGVEATMGATITGVQLNSDWMELISRRQLSSPNTETATPDGAGLTYILDIDVNNTVRFGTGFAFPVLEIDLALPPGTVAGDSISVSLVSSLGNPPVTVGYFSGSTLETNVTVIDGTVRIGDVARDFDLPGPADVFGAGSWDPSGVPGAADDLFIRNDGTATGSGAPLLVDEMRVGDFDGDGASDGTLELTGVDVQATDSLTVAGRDTFFLPDFYSGTGSFRGEVSIGTADRVETPSLTVGLMPVAAGATFDAEASLTLSEIEDVLVLDDLRIAELDGSADSGFSGSVLSIDGTSQISGERTLVVGGAVSVGTYQGSTDVTPTDLTIAADGEFEGFTYMTVGRDLEIANHSDCSSVAPGTIDLDATSLWQGFFALTVGEDLEINSGICGAGSDMTSTANVSFNKAGDVIVGDDFEVSRLRVTGEETIDVTSTVLMGFVILSVGDNFDVAELVKLEDGATGSSQVQAQVALDGFLNADILGGLDVGVVTLQAASDSLSSLHATGVLTANDGSLFVPNQTLVGVVSQAGIDPGMDPGAESPGAQASADGSLIVNRASLSTGTLWIGAVEAGVVGDVTGLLDVGGYVTADLLQLGDGGTLALRVAADKPAGIGTNGETRYARVEVTDALLTGRIEASVDYTPALGVRRYDLIVAPDGTLADTTASFVVTALPPTFAVRSFGVVNEDGMDILRLEIEGPVLFADGFESGDTSAWSSAAP